MPHATSPDQDLAVEAEPSRRAFVRVGAAAVAGVAVVGTLAACGGGSSGGSAAAPSGGSAAAPSGGGAGAAPAAGPLAKLADIPVGQAVSATGPNGPIIIAQPTAGHVVAFSAKCTHMGCPVAPAGATLNCPCHGSKYDALTGAVLNGPAPSPLAPVAVKVDGADVVSA